ncbi:Flavonoid 3'-monooxygenase [Apostasia shenzhenica]|uniref:Flavonoid 3'-monooxygenase n=1 Tax=Apostasia shenzhenica TaxID=1088818 RepID=A0A2I0A9X3_9ASPA|nr:Flavonoid 3'-monooxygenase [Apostasia shenzhenica]
MIISMALAMSLLLIFSFILLIFHKLFNGVGFGGGGGGKGLPPGPPRWPIVGNLFQLGRLPHRDLAGLCSAYGPLVYLRLGAVDAITTDDPEVIREILLGHDDAFASRPRTVAAARLAYGSGDVALAPMGPHWKRMRRICMEHLLTTRRLEAFAAHRAEEAQHLLQEVWARATAQETVDLRQVLEAFSMNNVTRMLLGKQYFGSATAGRQEAMEFMAITHELFHLLGMIYLGDYLPAWRWIDPSGCERRMKEVEKKVDKFHQKIIDEHRERKKKKMKEMEEEEDDGEEMDFVDVLLSLPGEDGKEHLDDKEIKALVQDMIAAATDTSAVTNEWAMTELLRHPHVLRKAQAELDAVVGRRRLVRESDLPRLAYLRCVVRETFRLHPAGPFLIPHESLRPARLMGFSLPAGTRVFINTHALGRNHHLWGAAGVEDFRPERHEKGAGRVEISHGDDFVILPFGAGRRRCPGAPLGVVMVLLALATLLQGFDWSPADGRRPEEIEVEEIYGMTMPRATPLRAVAAPRLSAVLYAGAH